MAFKDRLKEARESAGLDQNEVAKRIGNLSNTSISNYENGTSFPKTPILFKLFEVLNTTPNFLFQDEVDISKILENRKTFNSPTYVIGENGEREVRYSDISNNKDRDALLSEMGIKKNTNYLMSKENAKTELTDNEYDFLINSLGFYRKK